MEGKPWLSLSLPATESQVWQLRLQTLGQTRTVLVWLIWILRYECARRQLKDSDALERKVKHLLTFRCQLPTAALALQLEGPEANPQDGYGTGGQAPLTLAWTEHNPRPRCVFGKP